MHNLLLALACGSCECIRDLYRAGAVPGSGAGRAAHTLLLTCCPQEQVNVLGACTGLGRHREAALALEEGLRLDPFDWPLKQALEAATQGILRDLVEGASPSHSHRHFSHSLQHDAHSV